MILNVRVIPKTSPVRNFAQQDVPKGISNGASNNFVKKEDNRFKVHLTKPAQDGLANTQLIKLLSEFLNIKKYRIKIIKGHKSRDKLIEVKD
jgi:hypothetical protein